MASLVTHPLSADAATKMVEELKRIQMCVDTQKYGTIAALLVVLLDHGDSFSQEIKWIWRARLSAAKIIFLVARYFGLFAQMINLAASTLLTTNNNTRNGTCSHWHISLLGATILIYMLSSISLSMTVHDLLNHSTRSRNILVGLHLFQFAFGCLCGYFMLVNKIYTPNCDSHSVAFALSLFGLIGGLLDSKLLIWGHLIARNILVRSEGTPWYRLVFKVFGDGAWAWVIHSMYLIVLGNFAYYKQHTQPHLLFSWPITIHVIGTCRLLLHRLNPSTQEFMQKIECPGDAEGQPREQTSSAHVSERSRRSRCTMQQVSRGAPLIGPSNSNQSRLGGEISTNTTSSDAIQVVPRSLISMNEDSSEGYSASVEFTLESGDCVATAPTSQCSSEIEIGSEHTNTSMSTEDERSIWRHVYGDRSSTST